MEYVLLGFLMIRSLSQYEMRKVLQRKVSPFYSASLGSIQAALKKLEADGRIECLESERQGRKIKLYSIREEGSRSFSGWMLSALSSARLDQDATTRLFFLGLMEPRERLAIANAIIGRLELDLAEYEAASAEAARTDVPDELRTVAEYQLKTLELGIHLHRAMRDWFAKFRDELEVVPDEGQNAGL